jgi:RHS repeat-associated protein
MNWHSQISITKHFEIRRRADNCTGFDTNYIKFGKTLEYVEKLSTLDNNEPDLYFYHSDHIGSSSFITDASGIASQHLQYLPFGELFVEQRSTANYYTPYKFSGKEKDEETSYSYFGARYYMSDISVWLSCDPMKDKYPYQSPYTYCGWNPIRIIDPDGRSEGDGIFVDGTGKQIGDDGITDGKVYVVKTTENLFEDGVVGAGLSQEEQDKTIDFIQSNSGNTAAFQSDDIAYRNSIEIDGNADNRQEMVDATKMGLLRLCHPVI